HPCERDCARKVSRKHRTNLTAPQLSPRRLRQASSHLRPHLGRTSAFRSTLKRCGGFVIEQDRELSTRVTVRVAPHHVPTNALHFDGFRNRRTTFENDLSADRNRPVHFRRK